MRVRNRPGGRGAADGKGEAADTEAFAMEAPASRIEEVIGGH